MKSTKNYFVNKLLLLLFYTDHVTRFTPFRLNEKLLFNYLIVFFNCFLVWYEKNMKTVRNLKNVFLTKKGITGGFLAAKIIDTRNEKAKSSTSSTI